MTQTDPALTHRMGRLQIQSRRRRQPPWTATSRPSSRPGRRASSRTRFSPRSGWRRRTAPAASCSTMMFFWDEALAELERVPENPKAPAAACARARYRRPAIRFHRGEIGAARRDLAGRRLIRRSGSKPDQKALSAAPKPGLRVLRRAAGGARHADRGRSTAIPKNSKRSRTCCRAVRLATETGDLITATALAERVGELAAESEIPHRQANAPTAAAY